MVLSDDGDHPMTKLSDAQAVTVEATRTREVGPNKTGAEGSTPVYRITRSLAGSGLSADTTMHGLLKRPGYRLYAPDSPEAAALLAEQGLSPAGLDRALAELERTEGTTVRTIVWINEDAVFGTSRESWPRPARRRPRAPHPTPLAQGARAAWPGARGQHGAVRQGRHAAGRGPGRRQRLPAGQLRRRPEALSAPTQPLSAAAASRPAAIPSERCP